MPISTAKLAELFGANAFGTLTSADAAEELRDLVRASGVSGLGRRMRIRNLYDRAYEKLFESYRCEYVFKNELTHKIFLKNHAIRDTSARLLSEFWVGDSKADVVMVNGTSTVYEIKTSLDTVARLPLQLSWYSKIFDRIFVVTSPDMAGRIEKLLPKHVGLMILDEFGDFSIARQATSNKASVSVLEVFHALREREVVEICQAKFGMDPDIDPDQRALECPRLFQKMSTEEAHEEFVSALRKRPIHEAKLVLIESAPDSLKHLCIDKNVSVAQYRAALRQLDLVA